MQKIIEYSSCLENQKFLRQIEAQEWNAAKYLAMLLKENRLRCRRGQGRILKSDRGVSPSISKNDMKGGHHGLYFL